MCVQKERLHPTQHSHRVTKTTVTSQRNTWRCAARAPQPLSSGWVQVIAAPDRCIRTRSYTLSLRPIAFLKYVIAFPSQTPYHTLHTTPDYGCTHTVLGRAPSTRMFIPQQSSGQSAIHQDVHTPHTKYRAERRAFFWQGLRFRRLSSSLRFHLSSCGHRADLLDGASAEPSTSTA